MTPEQLSDFLAAIDSSEMLRVWRELATVSGQEPFSVGLGLAPATTGAREPAIHAIWLKAVPARAPKEVEIQGKKYPVIATAQSSLPRAL